MTTMAQAIKSYVQSAGGKVTAEQIKHAINAAYPNQWKPSTLQAHLYACAVNNPKAYLHHPSAEKFLYRNADGTFELYAEERHGPNEWAPPEGNDDVAEVAELVETSISLERDIEDYLVHNLDAIERGLTLVGRQVNTEVGRIDILLWGHTVGRTMCIRCNEGKDMARTKLDHALIAVKAGLNLIPFVGGFLASLVEYIPSTPRVTISYPWLETNVWLLGKNNEVKEIRLHVGVRDEPAAPEAKKGVLTVSSLQNLRLEVSMPVAVSETAGGWHSCTVGCVDAVEWNNYVSTSNPIGIIELKNAITVLEIRGSSSNAIWSGTVVIHRKGNHVDWEKSLGGWVKTPQGQQSVLVGETRQNGVITPTKGKPIHVTPDLLIHYGIPVKANGDTANACETPAQSPLPTPPN